jgi:hypothetical protein
MTFVIPILHQVNIKLQIDGSLTMNCSDMEKLDLALTFSSGTAYHISPVDLYGGSSAGICSTFIVPDDSGSDDDGESLSIFPSKILNIFSGTPMGNLGDTFLKNVYTVYRYDDGVNGTKHSIGFAASKNITSNNSTGSGGNNGGGNGGNGGSSSGATRLSYAALAMGLPLAIVMLL